MDLPGYNIELVKKRIRELQEKYEKEIKPNEKDYNEQNTKKDFIEPILRILNWDTETKNQVDAEFCIKNQRSSGSADYALKINEEVKLLLEAKSFDKDLETGYDIVNGQKRTYVEQLVGYAFDLNRHMKTKIDYCILTNGKEWRVYNVQWQGVIFDKKLVFVLKIDEFIDKFRKFWSLEKGNVAKRDIDRFVTEGDKLPIDKKAVNSLVYCKKLLIDSIINDYEKNTRDMKYIIDKLINHPIKNAPNGFPKFHEMPEEERLTKFVLEASSVIINKILFIRIVEDKGYLTPKLTKKSVEEWKLWFKQADKVLSLFRTACHEVNEIYNGGIFDINPYDELNYDNDILDKIISILGDFQFEEIDADVIGRIYEIYLGTILEREKDIRGKKRTKLSSDYTERKKLGQYYTPKFVVDFIVKNTLGRLLEGKTPKEVSQIKVLDPACGSGSFLIRAFDYLKDYYVRYNDQQMSKIKKNGVGNMNNYVENGEIIDYNHRILKENLHGVDLNDLSVQICSINLWLRALEKDKKLEKLSKNILHGNSLISGVEDMEELAKYKAELKEIAKLRDKIKEYYGKELNKKEQDELEEMESKLKELRDKVSRPLNENLKKYFENLDLVHPFNWEVEFTEVFEPDKPEEEQGFDVVIGNPPYVRPHKIEEAAKSYLWKTSRVVKAKGDLYAAFIGKGIDLLKEGGLLSFIVPHTWLSLESFEDLRKYILEKCKIMSITFCPRKVFEDAEVETIVFVFEKCNLNETRQNNNFEIRKIDDVGKEIILGQKKQELLYESRIFDLSLGQDDDLISKIAANKQKLKDLINFFYGLKTADDEKFLTFQPKNKTDYKKLLRRSDFSRYSTNFKGEYVFYKPELMIKNRSTARPGEPKRFEEDKIVIMDIAKKLVCTFDTKGYYVKDALILKQKNKEIDLKYLTALINSKVLNYYYLQKYKVLSVAKNAFLELPIKVISSDKQKKIINAVDQILDLVNTQKIMLENFTKASNNQPIPDEKACKFAHYWDSSNFYDFSKDTIPFANKTKAKILDMEIKEEGDKLVIYTTNISLVQDKKFDNIKTVELTIKNEILKKFLYFSTKKYINEKRGSFGSGIILEIIKNIPILVYVANVKQNLDKIKKVMDDFEHETKDLWKIDGKTYKSLSDIEEDIEKTDKEIDERVYKLYGISEEEKKVIEESLK